MCVCVCVCSAVVVLGYCCVGRGNGTRGLGETAYHPFTQKGLSAGLQGDLQGHRPTKCAGENVLQSHPEMASKESRTNAEGKPVWFSHERWCIDHIFTLWTLAEKAREFNTTLYLAFVNLRKAYDSVNREALWLVLEGRYQVPIKLICILRALHQGTKGVVRALWKGVRGVQRRHWCKTR